MSTDGSDITRAVLDGNVGIVKNLLSKDPKLVFTEDEDSRTPLHWAVSLQKPEMVKILLDPYSNVTEDVLKSLEKTEIDIDDMVDDSGWTPLHIAAAAGSFEIFKELATHVSLPDVQLQTSTGQTCLHYAVSKNNYEIVNFLLTHLGASTRIKDKKGQLPIHRAAAVGSTRMVEILVQTGKSPVDPADSFGYLPIHYALAEGHGEVAVQLVVLGSAWKTPVSSGESTLSIAVDDKVRSFFKSTLLNEGLAEEADFESL